MSLKIKKPHFKTKARKADRWPGGPVLDLHGRTKEEIFDLLDPFIRKHKDKKQALIIPGRGRGIVKNEVLEYLKRGGYTWTYEKIKGHLNEGAVIVDFE